MIMMLLIIDDSLELLDILSNALSAFNWKIMQADNGMDGLEIFKAHNGQLDAVLLDQIMPVIEGIQVLPKLQEINPYIPVIMMTGHSSVTLATEFMKMGGSGFIEKPIIQFEVLKIRIEEAVQHNKQKRELEIIREERHLANKLNEAKDSFLSNLSHELRTPLTTIFPFAVMAKRKLAEGMSDEAVVILERLLAGQERLMRFVTNIECLARIYTHRYTYHPSANDLAHLIRDIVQDMNHRPHYKNLQWRFSGLETLSICFDAKVMRVALTEILGNAIRFSPEGGVIEIITTRSTDNITVSILDCGVGIPIDECERIFDPFSESSRTLSHAGGTGLGLSIARGLVQLHGGTVCAHNKEEGQGAVVTLTLPNTEFNTTTHSKNMEHSEEKMDE